MKRSWKKKKKKKKMLNKNFNSWPQAWTLAIHVSMVSERYSLFARKIKSAFISLGKQIWSNSHCVIFVPEKQFCSELLTWFPQTSLLCLSPVFFHSYTQIMKKRKKRNEILGRIPNIQNDCMHLYSQVSTVFTDASNILFPTNFDSLKSQQRGVVGRNTEV